MGGKSSKSTYQISLGPRGTQEEFSNIQLDTEVPVPKPLTRLIGFDFDCTLTSRHFFKVFAWGFASGNERAHRHCPEFFQWCRSKGIQPGMQSPAGGDAMNAALDEFCFCYGEELFREAFRNIFLGGEERIAMIANWLQRMSGNGVEFSIVTAGTSTAVLRGLCTVPEWLRYFNSNRIWDTQQGRHRVGSIMSMKALMLRDISPDASKILLVDDSMVNDAPFPWVLEAAQVVAFDGDLPYEGPGLDAELLKQVEHALMS
eukprot:gnl/TRDRNA2_/TRDRNA2_82947_c0_seq1.p1 gnl/TRDRNA2_/TRDRNA2_82947_c0~~gnl/TRDRNA2_/TRDRNA2_82947_c0_seq1.p1  ORF type:complete len:259 (+),score=43.72 gnl/TRDRNA2_/TRDRNA2_82947_c0_seq1:58-834(+)